MKKCNIIKSLLALSVSGLMGAGCYVQGTASGPSGEVYVDSAPPALLVETEPPAPGTDFLWIGGNWFWEGGRWQWHAGYWGHPPHAGAHWVANHYENRGGRHVYVRGGWR